MQVETFGSPASVEESIEQVQRLATLTGQPDRGAQLAQTLLSSEPPQAAGYSALLWQPGEIVAGASSLVSAHLAWAELSNHAAAQGLEQADRVSIEQVLSDPPDILLVAGDAPGQLHPLLETLESTHVAQFDPSLFYCAGPSIPKARERLAQIVGAAREAKNR